MRVRLGSCERYGSLGRMRNGRISPTCVNANHITVCLRRVRRLWKVGVLSLREDQEKSRRVSFGEKMMNVPHVIDFPRHYWMNDSLLSIISSETQSLSPSHHFDSTTTLPNRINTLPATTMPLNHFRARTITNITTPPAPSELSPTPQNEPHAHADPDGVQTQPFGVSYSASASHHLSLRVQR